MIGIERSAWTIFKLYSGNGLLMLYFVVALVFLFRHEKSKSVKLALAFTSAASLITFFLPPVTYIFFDVFKESDTYYRFIWMIPMTVVSAYATIRIIDMFKPKWLKIVLGMIAMICVMIGGNSVYNSPVFYKASNIYQMPPQVVEICDAITIPGREVSAVFPDELLQYPRQYDATVVMPYGYDNLINLGIDITLQEVMEADEIDAQKLVTECRFERVKFAILPDIKPIVGNLEEYGFEACFHTDGYTVYEDTLAHYGE